ncbi:MAG TPA: GDSL-type esterase/lipase family protein [Lacipirellulaceae bacterium]|nr:GDSL-type esterase/lipase family protein [Lacipirellulaceae bacterium]
MSRQRGASSLQIVGLTAVIACAGAVILFAAGDDGADLPDRPAARTDANSQLAHQQLLAKAQQGRIDVYFLGDSITRRWGCTDPQYADLLAHWREQFHGWHAANFGWGADQTQHILWRLEHGELDGIHPKVIVVLAGTNNIRPLGEHAPADAVESQAERISRGVAAIVRQCRQRAPDATVILTAVFPRSDQPGVMPVIEAANRRIVQLADGSSIRWLDVSDRLADSHGTALPAMFVDGLHPTVAGYQAWADGLRPLLTELLGPPGDEDFAPPPTGDPSSAH